MNDSSDIMIVCPPSLPPPAPPPDFSVWSKEIPSWFWGLTVVMGVFSIIGFVNVVWMIWVMRSRNHSEMLRPRRLEGSETESSLQKLASRVKRETSEWTDKL